MMKATLRRLLRNSTGATAIEYGMIAALIVIVMVGSLAAVATTTTDMWYNIATTVLKS